VTSLLPDDQNDPYTDQTLSDLADGTDSLAHLTVIAPAATTRVDWLLCPTTTVSPVTQAQLSSCNVAIGSDSTPKTPAQGTILTSADEAYDVKWNIPVEQDAQTKDILILACVGEGQDVEGSGQNCRSNLEEGIFLDDASGGSGGFTNTSSAGEMFAICTSDTDDPSTTGVGNVEGPGSPGAGADPCQLDTDESGRGAAGGDNVGNGTGTVSNDRDAAGTAAVAALFKPWEHGDPVPNNGFVLRASTSADTFVLQAGRQYNPEVNSSTDWTILNQQTDCSLIQATTTSNLFECVFPDTGTLGGNETAAAGTVAEQQADDNRTQAVGIFGGSNGSCNSCLMDAHWTASSDRGASAIVATFDANPPSPATGTSCTNPDKEETNALGQTEAITVCVKDQFGDAFGGDITLESAGVGDFLACPGVTHDHDGNGTQEHCHITAAQVGGDGTVSGISIENAVAPGDQTVTVCSEGEIGGGAGSGNPAPAGHGCADESVKDTLVKHWLALPAHIHLVFQGTGTAADPCHSGDTNKENVVGDTDTLLACTFSSGDVPATTNQTNGGRLQWTIVPVTQATATRFVGSPPSETGADGTATAQLEAFQPGNDIITVSLCNDTGGCPDSASVQKRVTGTGGETPQCSDNVDNDGDGKVDFGQDPGCASADDDDEADIPTGSNTSSKSTITIRYDSDSHGGTFKGAIANSKNKCVKGRHVTLKRVRRGPDQTVGTDSSNRSGNWAIREPGASGRYYAKVSGSRYTKRDGFRHTCGGDKSVTIRVQPA
jgi:hypothetical protein